jgi:single-strand DNA-binding protein
MTNQQEEKSVNTAILSGTLQAAEIRYTGTGDAVSNATLEVIDTWKEGKPKKQWLRVVLWRGLATKAAELPKDSKVRVCGRMETVSWTDKASGEKKYRTQIVAASLEPIQNLQEIPLPKEKPVIPSKMTGTEVAAAILRPHSSAITPAYPITDEDIPF